MPKVAQPNQITQMLRFGTPVDDHVAEYGLWVKREDLACLPPGPPFSKTRGVFSRVASRPESLIGALDTSHSQAGHAVARACQILGKQCINYYPEFKNTPGPKTPQLRAQELGAQLHGLKAGRSAILYHQARRHCESLGGYMMPNALKLHESVTETAKEVPKTMFPDLVLVPISSGTIAAGVIKGFNAVGHNPTYLIHMGYSRSHEEVRKYLAEASGVSDTTLELIDEGYEYKDQATSGDSPPWPCNAYYDLKAFRWWLRNRSAYEGESCLMWNVG